MTDNFNKIRELLNFNDNNTFYYVMILQRRKENPEMKKGVRTIDNFYLYSLEDLDKLRDKIIESCTKYNARAYINPNKLDLEKIALFTQKKIIDLIIAKQYKSIKNAYASVCGSHHSQEDKRWVVDIDAEEIKYKEQIIEVINELHKLTKKDYKIVAELPSKSGIHLISNPFNIKVFNDKMNELGIKIDVQKTTPTILYCV